MKDITIKLDGTDKVKDFSHKTAIVGFDIDLVSGRYIVDAKSIMGIFSLDLSKNITAKLYSDNDKELDEFISSIKQYIVD